MASLLETFYILFESSGTSKLKADLKATDVLSKNLGQSFVGLAKDAAKMGAALVGLGAIFFGIRSAITYADRLDELSKALNVNIEDLSAWGDAVQLNGGTAEGFQETAKSMTAALADFATKGKSRVAPFFKELGISMTDSRGKARDFLTVLPEIADKFEKLGKQEAFGIGRKMGLDQGTIMLLQQGRREVDAIIKRQKELGVVTKEDAEIAAKFNAQWDYTAHAFRSLFTTINSYVLPPLTAILNSIEKIIVFMRKNKDFVIGALISLGAAITRFVLPPLISMAAAAAVAYAPFIGLAVAISAITAVFALLYDDFMTFKEGGDSLIGDIVSKWPVVKTIIDGISESFTFLWRTAKKLFSYLIGIFTDPLGTWKIFVEDFKKDFSDLIELFPGLGRAFEDVGKFITLIWEGLLATIQSGIDLISAGIAKVKSLFNSENSINSPTVSAEVKHNLELGKKYLNIASNNALTTQPNSLISNKLSNAKNTNIQVGDITINAQNADANEVSTIFGKNLKEQLRQATGNFDDGVLA